MDKWVKRIVGAVIAVNVLQLLLYQQVWNGARTDSRVISAKNPNTFARPLKPWPSISSFQSWNGDPLLKPYTCEGYFGHGFADEYNFLKSLRDQRLENMVIGSDLKEKMASLNFGKEAKDAGGSFRCLYSETLHTSICEGTHLVMNLEKITVSRGGEDIHEVIGRDEESELPTFSKGTFQVQVAKDQRLEHGAQLFSEDSLDKLMAKGQIHKHTLRSLLLNLQAVYSGNVRCLRRVAEPTVFVTRFEYANLFHTVTDWFSAYISSRVAGLPNRPHLVLLDGHCKSPMDDGWEAMFSSVTYAMHFNGPVCFDHAIFAPLGYDTPLFKHIGSALGCSGCSAEELGSMKPGVGRERKTARLREFGEFFVKSFEPKRMTSSTLKELGFLGRRVQTVNVLFVRREDYLAHPRHTGKPESRLSNEEEVFRELKKLAEEKSTKQYNITIVNGLLAHMTLEEQIQAVTVADILVGAHGAGLTHLVFARPTTVVLELLSPNYRRPHFETLSHWMGMDYRVIHMESSFANTGEVRERMNEILEDLKRPKRV